jgi:hypothetical protein
MSDETETVQQQDDDEFDDVYGEAPPADEHSLVSRPSVVGGGS